MNQNQPRNPSRFSTRFAVAAAVLATHFASTSPAQASVKDAIEYCVLLLPATADVLFKSGERIANALRAPDNRLHSLEEATRLCATRGQRLPTIHELALGLNASGVRTVTSTNPREPSPEGFSPVVFFDYGLRECRHLFHYNPAAYSARNARTPVFAQGVRRIWTTSRFSDTPNDLIQLGEDRYFTFDAETGAIETANESDRYHAFCMDQGE